jgi:hypothetical protein
VRIYPDGKVEGKTLGVKGKECTAYIKAFEELLQARAVEGAYTNEYYQSEATVDQKAVDTTEVAEVVEVMIGQNGL